jgi:hypothetical protein
MAVAIDLLHGLEEMGHVAGNMNVSFRGGNSAVTHKLGKGFEVQAGPDSIRAVPMTEAI